MRLRFLRGIQWLEGPDLPIRREDVLVGQGQIIAIGSAAVEAALAEGIEPTGGERWLLAPALVDPHSVLEEPFSGRAETLDSLVRSAIAAGYGTLALLPRARLWRDRPEQLQLPPQDPFELLLWGSFSLGAAGQELAPHGDQLQAGAVGLAEDDQLPPLALLERGLLLAEGSLRPLLLAPRQLELCQRGFVRETVEALRAGWPVDPPISEILPLQSLLTLAAQAPGSNLRLMNLSTQAGVELLAQADMAPPASVCWWHLLADSGCLDPLAEGWRVVPSLGGPADRTALIDALASGVLTAVAVHHLALDAEEQLLPLDQRQGGVAGHRFVLPSLWQELVVGRGWSVEALWEALCWGPARFLAQEPPRLAPGSRRWLLFDPDQIWSALGDPFAPLAANQPLARAQLTGQVLACGLNPDLWRGPSG